MARLNGQIPDKFLWALNFSKSNYLFMECHHWRENALYFYQKLIIHYFILEFFEADASLPVYQKQCGQQNHSSDGPLYTALVRATPWVLGPVQGPVLQEGHWDAGLCPEKSNKAGEHKFYGKWGCSACRKGGPGGPHCSLQLHERRL